MHIDLIKQHLNLHLLLKRFLIENDLSKDPLKASTSSVKESETSTTVSFTFTVAALSELFQPFLLEYIRLQEDQFVKYAVKIHDVSRINSLADEIARMIEHNRVVLLSMSSIEAATAASNSTSSFPMHGRVLLGRFFWCLAF